MSSSAFVAAGILVQHLVIVLDGGLIVAFAIINLTQVILRISRQISIAVGLQVLSELLRGQIIFTGIVIAERSVIEHIRGRRLILSSAWTTRSSARLTLGRRLKVLLCSLDVIKLLADFCQPRFELVYSVMQRLHLAGNLVNFSG